MIKETPVLIPVVLSGGTGSRLWPLSREGHPKPFIQLFDGETLLEKTYRRISRLQNIPKINGKPFVLTVTNREYYFISKDELDKTNASSVFLLEPESKNTAPAISMAALWIKKNYGDIIGTFNGVKSYSNSNNKIDTEMDNKNYSAI